VVDGWKVKDTGCATYRLMETSSFVSLSSEEATETLKTNYRFMFATNTEAERAWRIGTWSRKTKQSKVEKNGSALDKARLSKASPMLG